MAHHHQDVLLVTNPINIRYLTGFVGVDERDAYVLLTPDTLYFFTNSLYSKAINTIQSPIRNTQIKIIEISRENPISKEVEKIISNRKIQELGFEDDNLTVAEYTKIQSVLKARLVPSRGTIESLRAIKRSDEIENIRLAATMTDQCFSFITTRIRPGVTEAQLAWEIEKFIRSRGAELAFCPIVAFGAHSAQPHYQKSASQGVPLQSGNLVLLDFGARVNGYCADMTRVVFLGTPKPAWVNAYETVLAAHNRVLSLMESGERHGAALDSAARQTIVHAGLPAYPHSLGHAVGLAIHEAPRLTEKRDEILTANMVVTVEPATYIEGQYGIRIEDLVRITDHGIEALSKSQNTLMVL